MDIEKIMQLKDQLDLSASELELINEHWSEFEQLMRLYKVGAMAYTLLSNPKVMKLCLYNDIDNYEASPIRAAVSFQENKVNSFYEKYSDGFRKRVYELLNITP